MSKQVGIRWNSNMGTDYDASVAALRQYRPPPKISVSIRFKGQLPEDKMKALMAMADELGVEETYVTLTATWPEDEDTDGMQLRLFPPHASEQENPFGLPNGVQ